MEPDYNSVIGATKQYKIVGLQGFLDLYASGRPPKAHFFSYEGDLYPLKAIWSAAHNPPRHNRDFSTGEASRGLRRLGFTSFIQGQAAEQYLEGELRRRETSSFARNQLLVRMAKEHYGYVCRGCDFDFECFYGELGRHFIECHHVDPISGRGGKMEPKTLEDVTVLCSNCHRMVHKPRKVLTVAELRDAIDMAKDKNSN